MPKNDSNKNNKVITKQERERDSQREREIGTNISSKYYIY